MLSLVQYFPLTDMVTRIHVLPEFSQEIYGEFLDEVRMSDCSHQSILLILKDIDARKVDIKEEFVKLLR